MILLHFAPIRWPQISGPRTSVPGLVSAQNRLKGVDAGLAVTVAGEGEVPELDFPVFDGTRLSRRGSRLDLPRPFDRPDLAVFHSTYIPAHARIARVLRRVDIPYLICPRGGMNPLAQATRRWKKRLGNVLFFNGMVRRAAALQCLTHAEAEAAQRWGRRVFVSGNGVVLPPDDQLAAPGSSAARRFVFLGRLHVDHKGLDMLLEACHLVRDRLVERRASVELHGPDCRGSAVWLARRIAAYGLQPVVALGGSVVGRQKSALLRGADVFLHPSRTEGHPSAVLEALSYGVPCLLTPQTNMADEVSTAGAGWRVEAAAAAIASGIERVLNFEGRSLQEAGRNARALAVRTYDWPRIAEASVETYRRYAA